MSKNKNKNIFGVDCTIENDFPLFSILSGREKNRVKNEKNTAKAEI